MAASKKEIELKERVHRIADVSLGLTTSAVEVAASFDFGALSWILHTVAKTSLGKAIETRVHEMSVRRSMREKDLRDSSSQLFGLKSLRFTNQNDFLRLFTKAHTTRIPPVMLNSLLERWPEVGRSVREEDLIDLAEHLSRAAKTNRRETYLVNVAPVYVRATAAWRLVQFLLEEIGADVRVEVHTDDADGAIQCQTAALGCETDFLVIAADSAASFDSPMFQNYYRFVAPIQSVALKRIALKAPSARAASNDQKIWFAEGTTAHTYARLHRFGPQRVGFNSIQRDEVLDEMAPGDQLIVWDPIDKALIEKQDFEVVPNSVYRSLVYLMVHRRFNKRDARIKCERELIFKIFRAAWQYLDRRLALASGFVIRDDGFRHDFELASAYAKLG